MKRQNLATVIFFFYTAFLFTGILHIHRLDLETAPVIKALPESDDYYHSGSFCHLNHTTYTLYCEELEYSSSGISNKTLYIPAEQPVIFYSLVLSNQLLRAPPQK